MAALADATIARPVKQLNSGSNETRERGVQSHGSRLLRGNPATWSKAPLAVAFLLLLVAVYSDPLLTGQNFGGGDLLGYHLPVEKMIHQAYARHRFPVWSSEIAGGRPLLANPNAGALYPLRPLLSVFRFPVAMRLFPTIHWFLAGLGIMALAQTLGWSSRGAWVAAVTYVLSGVAVGHVFFTNLQPGLMLLPWIVFLTARSTYHAGYQIVALSMLLALLLLAGDPFSFALALLCSVLWVTLEMKRDAYRRALTSLVLSLFLAALLAAPQLVASILWLPETHRAVSGLKLGTVLRYCISPWRLLEAFIPFPFGPVWSLDLRSTWAPPVYGDLPMGFYATLYSGAFATIAILCSPRLSARGSLFGRVLLVLSLGLAIPGSFLSQRWGHISSPVPLRYPEKLAVALVLAAAILAGLFYEDQRRSPSRRAWPLAIGGVLCVLAVTASLFPEFSGRAAVRLLGAEPELWRLASDSLPGAIAEGGLLWMSALVAINLLGRSSRAELAALLLLTIGPVAANRRIAWTFKEEAVFAPTPFARALRRLDPSGNYRTLGESLLLPPSKIGRAVAGADVALLDFPRENWAFFTSALWDRGMVFNFDYDQGDLSRMNSLRRRAAAFSELDHPAAFFGSFSLRYGTRLADQPPVPGYRGFAIKQLQAWDYNSEAAPDIRLLTHWTEKTDAIAVFRALPGISEGEALLETGREKAGSARPGRLRILDKTPERLRLETFCADRTWLFVLRGFFTYRKVFLDGAPVSVVPAQLAFCAVSLPPGAHRLEWREEIPGGKFSVWGPVIYLAGAFIVLRVGGRLGPAVRDDRESAIPLGLGRSQH